MPRTACGSHLLCCVVANFSTNLTFSEAVSAFVSIVLKLTLQMADLRREMGYAEIGRRLDLPDVRQNPKTAYSVTLV